MFKNIIAAIQKRFPLKDFQIKVKDLQAPWTSKEFKKLSKQKQKLNIKLLKRKSIQTKQTYKNYKHLFEKNYVKKLSKRT